MNAIYNDYAGRPISLVAISALCTAMTVTSHASAWRRRLRRVRSSLRAKAS